MIGLRPADSQPRGTARHPEPHVEFDPSGESQPFEVAAEGAGLLIAAV